MSPKIVYCMMAMNRLSEVKHCINLVRPYVDEVVIIDGGSLDESFYYLKNRKDVNAFLHPWRDNFSEQRNNYIKRAREVIGDDNFYCLVSDPDEWFEEETLKNLRSVVDFCEKQNANMAQFQCRSVSLKGDERVWENLDNYWKGLLFKYEPGIHYIGNPHETLVPPSGLRPVRTPFIYEHVKQENIIWVRGARNAYINGGGPNLGEKNQLWVELKKIVCDVYGRFLSWHEYENEMMKGNIDERLKLWMYKAKDETGWDGASEMREHYKMYFRLLNFSEEPEEFRGTHIE